jgi:hypothetical protein
MRPFPIQEKTVSMLAHVERSAHRPAAAWHRHSLHCSCQERVVPPRRGASKAFAFKGLWSKLQRREEVSNIAFSDDLERVSPEAVTTAGQLCLTSPCARCVLTRRRTPQVSALWAEAGLSREPVQPERIALALRHSFALVAAFAAEGDGQPDCGQLVGLAR